jgi:glutamate 5-kinase
MEALRLKERPRDLNTLQAIAAVGQSLLMKGYEEGFGAHNINVAQVLLTADDVTDRRRYVNVRNTVLTLFNLGVVPVVNENDTIAVDEIRYGDNDKLSAHVAVAVEADLLILLSGSDGLLGPGRDGARVPVVEEVTPVVERQARRHPKAKLASKVKASRIATHAGIPVVMLHHSTERACEMVVDGEDLGTLFKPQKPLEGRFTWLLFSSRPKGVLRVDAGAKSALTSRQCSLLPSGVIEVEGTFRMGDTVSLAGPDGEEFARGIVNYTSRDAAKIAGLQTDEIAGVLGKESYKELVNSHNLVVL